MQLMSRPAYFRLSNVFRSLSYWTFPHISSKRDATAPRKPVSEIVQRDKRAETQMDNNDGWTVYKTFTHVHTFTQPQTQPARTCSVVLSYFPFLLFWKEEIHISTDPVWFPAVAQARLPMVQKMAACVLQKQTIKSNPYYTSSRSREMWSFRQLSSMFSYARLLLLR